jgi:hypothetical protein
MAMITAGPWTVYVDGLNFYAAVKGRPDAKWVDLRQLAERLVPANDRLHAVKYFTSQTSAKAPEDPASPDRQRLFIRAASSRLVSRCPRTGGQ